MVRSLVSLWTILPTREPTDKRNGDIPDLLAKGDGAAVTGGARRNDRDVHSYPNQVRPLLLANGECPHYPHYREKVRARMARMACVRSGDGGPSMCSTVTPMASRAVISS